MSWLIGALGSTCLWLIGCAAERPEPARPPSDVSPASAEEPGSWVQGGSSRLRAQVLVMPRHDADYGKTVLELSSNDPDRAPSQVLEREGVWRIIAYVEAAQAYLLGGIFESGAWLPVRLLAYLDERTGTLRFSHVRGTRWMAMTAISAPRGRYVAFVADPGESAFELEVLDALTDTLVRVDEAPAPPPLAADEAEFCPSDGRFSWGDPVDGFVPMDPGVIEFIDATTLVVRRGADTCRQRAREREERRWRIPELFAQRARVTPLRDE